MPKRLTQADFDETARERGGFCIHPQLPKRREKVLWQCSEGHQFAIRHDNVRAGTWCPICTNWKRPWDMDRIKLEMLGREFWCASNPDDVRGIHSLLTWECEEGHRWEASIANVVNRRSGCPHCRNKSETYCREVFEEFFDAPFPKTRPPWLGGLELDGLSDKRNRAFEYQGAHHYEEVPHFKVDATKLRKIQERDKLKVEICRAHFVSLYAIRHHPRDCTRKDDFQAYIESELVAQLVRERELLEQGRHWLQNRARALSRQRRKN